MAKDFLIKELLNVIPHKGVVTSIIVRPERKILPEFREQVTALKGHGLEGDRFNSKSNKREVTLIQTEHFAVVGAILQKEIDHRLTRRNIAVKGINLLSLKGQRFKIGEAIFEGTGECHPCTRMEENFELFCSQTTGKTLSIKSFLLDQRFICGIGNWIADEVLYQSKVCPTRRTCDLKSTELKSLSDAIKDVIQVAISCNADSDKFPGHWIFHHRWSKGKKNVLLDGNIVKFISINGRTTAYVPSIQF